MLYRLLLIILMLDSLVLIAAILLQAGKGSGLAANFGGASSSPDAFIGVRQAGTILTKATWWCAGIFLALAFILQVMSTRAQAPRSVLEKTFSNQPAPAAPAPTTGTSPVPLQPAPSTGTSPIPLSPAPATAPPGTTPPQAAAPATPPPAPTKR
ncbi:MAG TPA: preprotein translocase subunit SecG [Gemmatimonadaceae bacterium]|nr:preprotein translocase subunit SecG [Gemmatimonadaceae bacterium]